VRSLLVAIAKLPWQATGEHPAIEYLAKLQALYLAASNLKCNTHQRKVCTWIRRRSTASFNPRTG